MIRYFKNSVFTYFGKSSSFFYFFYQIYTMFLLKGNLDMAYDFISSNLFMDSSLVLYYPPYPPLGYPFSLMKGQKRRELGMPRG